MNYIGSKLKLSHFIKETVYSVVGKDLSQKSFCDLFAGTGVVGRMFKKEVRQVIANDLEYYSFVINKNYIENHSSLKYQGYIDELNNIKPTKKGFIYKNYCLGSGSKRQYFSDENGEKIDAVRIKIEEWYAKKEITERLYYFLLTSLLEAADKIANTASVYGAFLKHVKKSAQKGIILKPALFEINDNRHKVYNENANKLIKHISGDILYLDPPYNSRQYGANYHLLNTIAKYDAFVPLGKTGLRKYVHSEYCIGNKVKDSFEDIIKNADFKYIFLSYNNEGLMSENDIRSIMCKYGKYHAVNKKYQRFKSDKTENRKHKAISTCEFLHILEK